MSTPSQTWRLALAGAFACAGIALAACGGDDEETTTSSTTATTETGATGADGKLPAAAHIDLASGEVNGVEPDAREGTPPPPVDDSDLEAVADATGCDLQLDLPDELPKGGDPHLAPGQPAPEYGTTPPTAGLHDLIPQADGAYLGTPAPTSVLHSLEHGRVAIQYSPDLPEDEQLLLKGIFDDSPEGMLLFPNPDMPYLVAVTAWTDLVGCDVFGEAVLDVVRDFRDEFRGKGPEKIPL